MKMSEIIRLLRTEKGLTQEELGKVIGVQKSAIRKYESGLVENMKRSSIVKLANFFNVSPTYLLGYEENNTIDTELQTTISKLSDKQKQQVLDYIFENILK